MKICIIADIHLPYNRKSIQYKALEYALNDAVKKSADLLVFCGDQTADGNIVTAEYFTKIIKDFNIPYLLISGNADFRKNKQIFEE